MDRFALVSFFAAFVPIVQRAYHVEIRDLAFSRVSPYDALVIKSYKGKITEAVAAGRNPKGFPSELGRPARRKLFLIDTAKELRDLGSPPGNNLHPLTRDREGQHAIRINDQFRICFRWVEGNAEDVEITDHH